MVTFQDRLWAFALTFLLLYGTANWVNYLMIQLTGAPDPVLAKHGLIIIGAFAWAAGTFNKVHFGKWA